VRGTKAGLPFETLLAVNYGLDRIRGKACVDDE